MEGQKQQMNKTDEDKIVVSKRALGLVRSLLRFVDENTEGSRMLYVDNLCFDRDSILVADEWNGWYNEIDVEGVNFLSLLAETRNLLSPILDGVNKRIRTLKAEHIKCHDTCFIMQLPDEILLEISKLAFLAPDVYTRKPNLRLPQSCRPTPHILSAINKRFRSIVISSPFFWTTVSNGLTRPAFDAYLQRCGPNASIDVLTSFEGKAWLRHPSTAEFLKGVGLLAHRWRSFRFDYDSGYVRMADPTIHPPFHEQLARLHLPNLESLELNYEFQARLGEREDSADIAEFYTSWNMPRLRQLKCSGLLPLWEFKHVPAPPLVSMTIELEPGDEFHGTCVPLEPLRRLLANVPQLEHMDLTIPIISPTQADDTTPAFKNVVLHFDALKKFRLCIRLVSSTFDAFLACHTNIAHILASLYLPALQHAVLDIRWVDHRLFNGYNTTIYSDVLRRAVQMLQTSPVLEHIDVSLNFGMRNSQQPATWVSPIHLVHNLKHVRRLRLRHLENIPPLVSPGEDVVLPPLEMIHIECDTVTHASLSLLLRELAGGSHWNEFERMVINSNKLNKETMEEIFELLERAGKKLVWEPAWR